MRNPLIDTKRGILIGLAVVMIEGLVGSVSVSTGILYREYDQASAYEMMDIIREEDQNYYQLLNDPADPTYLDEFIRIHTRQGNPTVIAYGLFMIVMALLSAPPLVAAHQAFRTAPRAAEPDQTPPEEAKPQGATIILKESAKETGRKEPSEKPK